MNEENLSNLTVIKRSGKRVTFDGLKIAIAIKKGFDSIEGKYDEYDVNKIYNKVIEKIQKQNVDKIKIDEIQDMIEEELKENGYEDVYLSFSEYREKRNQSREIFFEEKRKHKFLKALEKLGLTTKENGEMIQNTKNAVETLEDYGKTVAEEFATSYLLKKKFSDEHENGDIFINKIESYPMGSTECTQIDLEKLFTDGFSTENCSMREPQSISSYSMLAIIAISSNQKDQNGEQSIPAFDYYMAPGVLKTFKKEFRQTIYDILEYTDFDKFIAINGIEREIDKLTTIDFDIEQFYKFTREAEELKRMFRIVYKKALEKTNKQTYQAMEAFVHDLNSLCPSKLTTINLGTDTSKEGRIIIENILKTIETGIGENKTPISPKVVFKIKKGQNFEEKDKNYDLLEKACQIAVKTNNIAFSFLDTNFNSQMYKEGDYNTEVSYFENGDRIIDNIVDNEKQTVSGRGIISSTTINLPRIAIKHKENKNEFINELMLKMDLVKDQMLERLEIQNNKKVSSFPFLMGQNVWMDAEKLKEDDKVKKALKQGVLQISFTGLYESIIALTKNKKLGEEAEALILAKNIVNKMNDKVNEYSKKYNLTFLLVGNQNKEIDKEFLELDRVFFGKIENITDKEMYTSSFELPEYYDINKKIKIESNFHELTTGGHVLKLKIDTKEQNSANNLLDIIKKVYKNEIGYVTVVK